MGKYLLIKDADFSENAVEQVVLKKYFYNIPDSQFLDEETLEWNLRALGYAIESQEVLSGNVIDGMRLNVLTAGVVTIYKATKPVSGLKNMSLLTQVATATANTIGLQDITFSSSVTLEPNECIVIGSTGDTLKGAFFPSPGSYPVKQDFYYNVGRSNITHPEPNSSTLNVDFFQIVNS